MINEDNTYERGILLEQVSYQKAKSEAKKEYSKIGSVHCTALDNDLVSFTRIGFNHLVQRGHKPRPKTEQIKRFSLIKYATQIITNPKAEMLFEQRNTKIFVNRHGNKQLVNSKAEFWTFISWVNGCRIKVVIRSIDEKQKHFFSIMGNKVFIKKEKGARTKKSSKL